MKLAGEAAPAELLFDMGAALVANGRSEEAIAIYERLSNLPELSTADRIAVLRELGQASYVTGQVERAAACYESAVSLAEQDHPALAVGAQAGLAERAGNRALAEHYFTQALDLFDELPMPLARAQPLTDYGAFFIRGGEMVRARLLLAEAQHIAEVCGAAWHANRARAEWRRAGGRTRARNPDELSPQEASVAQLAQVGRTNREIAQQLHLSIKTVETHLGHIYQKLGIRSRWQVTGRTIQDGKERLGGAK